MDPGGATPRQSGTGSVVGGMDGGGVVEIPLSDDDPSILGVAATAAVSRNNSSSSLHDHTHATLPRSSSSVSLQDRPIADADESARVAANPACNLASLARSTEVGKKGGVRGRGEPLRGGGGRRCSQFQQSEHGEGSLHSASFLVSCETQPPPPFPQEFALDCKELLFNPPQRHRVADPCGDPTRGDASWGSVPVLPPAPASVSAVPATASAMPAMISHHPMMELDFVGRTSRSSSSSSLQKIIEETTIPGVCTEHEDDGDGQGPDTNVFDKILAPTEIESKFDSPGGASTPGAYYENTPPHRLAIASGGTGECASTGVSLVATAAPNVDTPTKPGVTGDSPGLENCPSRVLETPRQAARRRKQEAADREAERLCEIARSNSRPQLCFPKDPDPFTETVVQTMTWDPCEPQESLREAAIKRKKEAADQEAERLCKVVQKAGRAQPCIPKQSGELFPAWEDDRSLTSTKESARRRKCEAADRNLEQLRQAHAGAAAASRETASRVKSSHTRSGGPPFATMDEHRSKAAILRAWQARPNVLKPVKAEVRATELPGCSRFIGFEDSAVVTDVRAS